LIDIKPLESGDRSVMREKISDQVKQAEETQAQLPRSIESCKRIVRTYRQLLSPAENPEIENAQRS
jgi:hypothetical protein